MLNIMAPFLPTGLRWLLAVAALFGCMTPDAAWANCTVQNSDINLGTRSSFSLEDNAVSSSGSAGISCFSLASLLSTSYIGIKIDQADKLLHHENGVDTIPFTLSWSQNGPQVLNGTRIDNLSGTLIGLLFSQNGQATLYAHTAPVRGVTAGRYRADVQLTWYWSICLLLGIACSNSSDDLTRNIITSAIINYGSGQTRTLSVILDVTRDCALSLPTVNFGQAALPSQFPLRLKTINARCTAGESFKVGIDNGLHPDGTTRRMASGSKYLAYDIWKGTSGSERWGEGNGNWRLSSEAEDNLTVNGKPFQGFRFRAQVRPDQAVPKGIYQDTVTVRVDY